MNPTTDSPQRSRRRTFRDILLYGLAGGLLIVILKLTEYRFLVVEHSVEVYGALIAAIFSALGIRQHGLYLYGAPARRPCHYSYLCCPPPS